MRKIKLTISTLAVALSTISAQAYNQGYPQQQGFQAQASYVAAGTPLSARLDNALGSEFSNVGDRFTATLATPIYAGSQLVGAPGSKVEGVVTQVEPAGRAGKPGSLELRITNIVTQSGQRIPLSASVDQSKFQLKAEGGRVSNYAKGTAAGAAGGALAGLLGSAVSGGKKGKGTALGVAMGSGVGILGATIKKGRELMLQAGSDLPFIVDSSAAHPSSAPQAPIQQYGSNYPGYQQAPIQQPPMQQPYVAPQAIPQAAPGGFADPYAAPPPGAMAPPPSAPQAPIPPQAPNPYANPYLEP